MFAIQNIAHYNISHSFIMWENYECMKITSMELEII